MHTVQPKLVSDTASSRTLSRPWLELEQAVNGRIVKHLGLRKAQRLLSSLLLSAAEAKEGLSTCNCDV
jgi:hypothetical protein